MNENTLLENRTAISELTGEVKENEEEVRAKEEEVRNGREKMIQMEVEIKVMGEKRVEGEEMNSELKDQIGEL